jgi:hypothetical protein
VSEEMMPRRQKPKLGLGARAEESEQMISSTKLSPSVADKMTPLCPVAEKSKPGRWPSSNTHHKREGKSGRDRAGSGRSARSDVN